MQQRGGISRVSYAVKDIFLTLQGEGAHSGRRAVFCRFSGCNLWSGREADRAEALCQFCDTDFVGVDGPGGGRFGDAEALAGAILAAWGEGRAHRFVVCTGGEPLLQLDSALITALHDHQFTIAIETNGTLPVPPGVDWVCVSPKAHTSVCVQQGNELKLVYPQTGLSPADVASWRFDHVFLQPMDGPDRAQNTRAAADYCLAHPPWRLSLQTHKIIGIA